MKYIDFKVTVWNRLNFSDDIEEQLTPDDNCKASTIEVYQNKELIWENGESELQQH